MENELGIAKKIQESFLPKSAPAVGGVEVSACMFTARQVGGDLYDFTVFDENRFGIMAGDVSGKGVPAALFMAMVVGSFRTFALPDAKPEEVLERLNAKLCKDSATNLFVTVFYSIFDMKAKTFTYGNGGHLPVLYLPKAGATQFLDVKEGAPLGLMEGIYSGGEIKFDNGDTFIFYTDGVTEAMNQKSDMYGKERLQAVAEKSRALSAEKLAAAIEKDVRRFEPKSQQHDDITIIVVKIA
jgi:sigma-B regulation protein RsbU (phosphoserine phosphatase)